MATTGFGLPTSLLNRAPQPTAPAASPPAIPSPPSFAEFRFNSIGQQPNLLKRFSEPDPTQQSETSSMSPDVDHPPMDVEENALPRNRPSLFQALTTEPRVSDASTNDSNLTNQASSTLFQTPATNSNAVPKLPFRQSSTSSSAFVSSAPNLNSPVHASSSKYSNVLGPTQSSHPSSSPARNGAVDQSMSDTQPTRSPDRPLVPLPTRRYETLRQIQSQLQAALPKTGLPNLTSAMLLVESAQQRTDRLYNEARDLHDLCQDIMHKAQQGQATALHLIEAAEEAKGVADGAKAELDRISSKEATQQRNADANKVRGLIQAVDDWIRNQEAVEAELRAKKIQQLKLKKLKSSVQTPCITSSHSSTVAQSPLSGSTAGPPSVNTPTSIQPLFFSPTPEVDVKMERIGSQPQQSSAAAMPAAEQFRKRQADLRKKLQEKRPSAEAESRAASPSNVTQSGQQQSEAEKRKMQDELKRKEEERNKEESKGKELERQQEEERRREEQAQREIIARREAEKAREEEARKQREKEAVEKKGSTEKETVTHQAAEKQRENRACEKAEAERKAKDIAEVQRKDAETRAAHAAEERKQAIAFLSQQKETKDELRQVPSEQRRRQSQEAQDKQRRLVEEQARMRAEQEREDRLRQEQEIRRQQIQAEKNRTMASRAQQIRAQRGHRLIPSQETTSEMSLDSSPQATNIIIQDGGLSPTEPRVPSYPRNPSWSPNSQSGPVLPQPGAKNQPLSISQSLTNGQKSVSSLNTLTHTPRQISLPPVEHLSPTDSASSHPRSVPLSQPAMSVYRLSSDGGNVPYREILTTSPQAQAANLKPLLNALKLPTINVIKVKPEPVPDDLKLSYPSEPSHGDTSVQSSSSQTQNGYQLTAARPLPPRVPSPFANQPSPSAKPTNRTKAAVDKPVPLSVTDAVARSRIQQQVSESYSDLQSDANSRSEPQNETLQLAPSNPTRSESPFRMGPDPLEPRPILDEILSMEFAYDRFSSQYPASSALPATLPPPYRGRLPTSNSAPVHWKAYPAVPTAPKGANVYRPNHRERSRSPAAGMKRARTPGSAPIIRDYREYDDRSIPMRRVSRSPPPRRPRRPSRSPSPFYATDRPSLYARLDDTYRPADSRDSYPSRPELLDRFTEPRNMAAPPPGRPGRGRGKRGKGGPPPVGPTHASLEQRISSTTLMSRLEDPPRRS